MQNANDCLFTLNTFVLFSARCCVLIRQARSNRPWIVQLFIKFSDTGEAHLSEPRYRICCSTSAYTLACIACSGTTGSRTPFDRGGYIVILIDTVDLERSLSDSVLLCEPISTHKENGPAKFKSTKSQRIYTIGSLRP